MNKPSIYSFCAAGCKWETMHKSDILKMQKWYVVKPVSGNEYYLDYGKEYRIVDENKFVYGEQNDSYLWNVNLEIGVVIEHRNGVSRHSETVDLGNFSKYDAEFTFELIDVTCHYDDQWIYNFIYKLNGELITESHQLAITSGQQGDEDVKIYFDDIPLHLTGAQEVLCGGDGTFPVSYTYDFSTLTEVTDLLDDDVFVIMRNDGKTYRVSLVTMKRYLGGSGSETEPETPTDDSTSAIVGKGLVGSMIIE